MEKEVNKKLDIAQNENIESIIISKDQLDTDGVLNLLKQLEPDLIVLAGFLLKIPKSITDTFKIVNLHPSLLPKFGGKGMYGMNVHKSVIESFEEESGISASSNAYKVAPGDDGSLISMKTPMEIFSNNWIDFKQKLDEFINNYGIR